MSAVTADPAPAPAAVRVRARRARWYREPTLIAGLVLLVIILFMCYGAPLLDRKSVV